MLTQKQAPKIAITGMNLIAGSCQDLDSFERIVYEGKQNFIELPLSRWQGKAEQLLKENKIENNQVPLGGYLPFKIDEQLAIDNIEELNPQELLMLKVANNALQDAEIKPGEKVAVIIATATQISLQKLYSKQQFTRQLQTILAGKTTTNHSALATTNISQTQSEYRSPLENTIATRISALWQFEAPAFTLTAEENSAFKALEVAQNLLVLGEVDAVVVGAVDLAGSSESVLLRNQLAKINTGVPTLSYDENANGWIVGEGAGAVVLKLLDTAIASCDRIYAVIDAISLLPQHTTSAYDSAAVTQVCQRAFQIADLYPQDIDYLEVHGSGVEAEDTAEIAGLLAAYQTSTELSCAIGSVKANIGHTYAAAEIMSLIKTALCLYYRYIPATPQWSRPKNPEIWQESPFYVATESKPWFSALEKPRSAAINSISLDGSYAHIILSEDTSKKNLTRFYADSNRYLTQMPFYLFAIAAENQTDLIAQLHALEQTIKDSNALTTAASQTFTTFQKQANAAYTLTLLGRNKDDLLREIQRAFTGVERAFEQNGDWHSPVGSYFTTNPLGKKGAIAYVYPGAYNSYVGISRSLFRLFPQIYDDIVIKSACNRVANIEKLLYPRSLHKLSKRQLESIEQQLLNDPLAMLESEMGYAGLVTTIFKNYFQIKPQCSFGYSLGETSMMFSHSVWTDFQECSNALNSSSLFSTRLAGSKDAVREFWGLPLVENPDEFWSTYVLITSVADVQEGIKQENQVYLTQINTSKECIIAGETQACLRFIEKLKCDAFRAPFNHVIHCEAMRSEYPELVRIKTLPVQKIPETIFYSSAKYAQIALNSESIAHHIAECLCQQVDFPRLVNRVYADGVRVFIEVGAGSHCSRWISENLKGQEHVTVSVNRRGVDDHTSILKALAKLLSHQVSLDLSSLYARSLETSLEPQQESLSLTLPLNQAKSDDNQIELDSVENSAVVNKNIVIEQVPMQVLQRDNTTISVEAIPTSAETIKVIKQTNPVIPLVSQQTVLPKRNHCLEDNNTYLKLKENNQRTTQIHTQFLQARQKALQQMSRMIQLQMNYSQLVTQDINTNPPVSKPVSLSIS
ncbi:PfaB family protein [Gloeocapsa sp. PCC 7428]|uniref:PfaB family protein n=1 Tax=Gloeocapsa sp. PCC 7428 TaxID=1173026 RepID=UPI0002A603D5|nr:type I polyketide synthase [Gloeocapsa sp. PCC 7428]AFZ30066.1 PfaB family protein [Gloeocapsa sp. PCC 7428]